MNDQSDIQINPDHRLIQGFLTQDWDISSIDVKSISPITLAYVGDAVYELYIRTHFLWPPQRINNYHNLVVAQVKAEQQAFHLAQLNDQLNDIEQDIVRRGRNAATKRPRRVDPEIYQKATGLEALIGYLYLVDSARLFELLQTLKLISASN